MSESNLADIGKSTVDSEITSKDEAIFVTEFLRKHPNFLLESDGLLSELNIIAKEEGFVSLNKRQTEQQQLKISALQKQLSELINNARRNEEIYKTYAKLNIELSKATTCDKIHELLQSYLVGILHVTAVKLFLIDETNKGPLSELHMHKLFEKKLAKSHFYLGRLSKMEVSALFDDEDAKSLALVHITNDFNAESKSEAMLAIASKDPAHFEPDMDTSLLNFLRLSLNYHYFKVM